MFEGEVQAPLVRRVARLDSDYAVMRRRFGLKEGVCR